MKSINYKEGLNATEIKILKAKILRDNNLDDMLKEENKSELSIERTIEDMLQKDNLLQVCPGNDINLKHLDISTQSDLSQMIKNYEQAFSNDSYDVGIFNGFPSGITLDVTEGETAFQRDRPIKGVENCKELCFT